MPDTLKFKSVGSPTVWLRSRPMVAGYSVAFLIVVLLGWEFADLDPVQFSQPSAIWRALIANYEVLLEDTWSTVQAAGIGLIGGTLAGAILAALFYVLPTVGRVFDPYVTALNAIPRPALAPLFIIWFGLGMTSKALISFSIVFFVVFYNVAVGLQSVDSEFIALIRTMRGNRWHETRYVLLPSIMTWVFAALRTSVAYSLLGAVAGELIGATAGLGHRLVIAYGLLEIGLVYAVILILIVIGTGVTAAARIVENYVLRWRGTGVGGGIAVEGVV